MLRPELWELVHPEGDAGFLHDKCLQARCLRLGVTLAEHSFLACLSYVNRKIHYPEPPAVQRTIAERVARSAALQPPNKRDAFAVKQLKFITAFLMREDTWALQPENGRSAFEHLF